MRALLVVVLAACGGDGIKAIDAPPGADAQLVDAAIDAVPDAAGSGFRIDEVFVNREGGDGTEYVEIRGPVGAVLDGLTLRVIESDGTSSAQQTYALSTTAGTGIGASGTWVIGGALASGRVDRILLVGDAWGLDNAGGAVQLLRGTTLVDVAGYSMSGTAVTPSAGLTAPTATVEGTVVTLPSTGTTSFGRRVGSADTGNNAADFCFSSQSAGAGNSACP